VVESDLVVMLVPDEKQKVLYETSVKPNLNPGDALVFAHGFNVHFGQILADESVDVFMVAPKGPGTEVREEYKRGFGVPTLLAVHTENDPQGEGLEIAKAYAAGTGGHRAGVLQSSFIAEVKSDLMGEQTILCGMLQTGSILCFDKMVEKGIDATYASKLIQFGWETVTEGLKHGGITNMMDRLSNPAKIRAFHLAQELKDIMRSLYEKHQDDIMTGHFSRTMMEDWANDDINLLSWRAATAETAFEKSTNTDTEITEQEFYDHGILMVAMVKAGVELAFETMVSAGIIAESAYYESLHETPLIANTIARKKLYEMNVVISDTAEYGCYLFDHACRPLLADFMKDIDLDVIGKGIAGDNGVNNQELIAVNEAIRAHPVEIVGKQLRGYMTAMKRIV
jgi:ketol-acid reductoisomerase